MPLFSKAANHAVLLLALSKRGKMTKVKTDRMLEPSDSKAEQVAVRNTEVPRLFQDKTAQMGFDFKHVEDEFDDYRKRQILLPHKMSQFGPAIAVADVDADGAMDFYVGGAAGQSGVLFIQNQSGLFKPSDNRVFEQDISLRRMDCRRYQVLVRASRLRISIATATSTSSSAEGSAPANIRFLENHTYYAMTRAVSLMSPTPGPKDWRVRAWSLMPSGRISTETRSRTSWWSGNG